jgi:hypothetical protein
MSRSQGLKNFNFAATAEDLDGHTLIMTMNQEVHRGIDQPEVFDLYVLERRWENGMVEANLSFGSAHAHAEAGAQEEKRRAGGPGLRSTSNRIESRPVSVRPFVEAAEKFWKTLEFDVAAHIE